MADPKTPKQKPVTMVQYRIHPKRGVNYYRSGMLYTPGQIVLIPSNECPPGWAKNSETGEFYPRERFAFVRLEDADPVKLELEDTAERVRREEQELMKKLEEKRRQIAELEVRKANPTGKPEEVRASDREI